MMLPYQINHLIVASAFGAIAVVVEYLGINLAATLGGMFYVGREITQWEMKGMRYFDWHLLTYPNEGKTDMVVNDDSALTLWQKRAKRSGLITFCNKRVADLSDEEIRKAFNIISRSTGIFYIWEG